MYKLIIQGDVKKGDLLKVDKVAGKTVHVTSIDTGEPQVRTGPKWKDVKPAKPSQGNSGGGNNGGGNNGGKGKGKGK